MKLRLRDKELNMKLNKYVLSGMQSRKESDSNKRLRLRDSELSMKLRKKERESNGKLSRKE